MKSSHWQKVSLGDVCDVIAGGTPSRKNPKYFGGDIPWVKISDMLQGLITFTDEAITKAGLENSAAKILPSGTVLISIFATIGRTAVLGVDAATNQAIVGVIPKPETKLNASFLRYSLDNSILELTKEARGVAQVNINGKILKSLKIPLPPLPEQERIVRLLDEAESLRATRERANVRMEQFVPELFQEMFGDVVKNEKNLNIKKFSELGQVDRGKSKHRPRDAAFLYGGSYPFVQTGDIANSNGQITSYTQTYSEEGLAQSKLWSTGTLCITIAANIGKTAILTFPACFPDSIVGFTPDNSLVDIEFIRQWLVTIESDLDAIAPQSAQKNINLGILRELPVPLPPLAHQCEFAARVEEARGVQSAQGKSAGKIEALYQSMLSRAFAGEL